MLKDTKSKKLIALQLCAGLGIVSLILVSGLLWMEVQRRFPLLSLGSYYGTIEGVFEDQANATLYVEREPGRQDLLVVVSKEGWEPQRLTTMRKEGLTSDNWLFPINLSGDSGDVLQLSGKPSGVGKYQGKAINTSTGLEGHWSLRRVAVKPGLDSADGFDLWLSLYAEYMGLEQNISDFEGQLDLSFQELKQVSTFLSNSTESQQKITTEISDKRQSWMKIAGLVREKKREAEDLGEKLKLAYKVTKKGRLVDLAREALDREYRWQESLKAAYVVHEGIDQQSWRRAEKLMKLKSAIAFEENRIAELQLESEL